MSGFETLDSPDIEMFDSVGVGEETSLLDIQVIAILFVGDGRSPATLPA